MVTLVNMFQHLNLVSLAMLRKEGKEEKEKENSQVET